ncbi:MAG: hypothetical protein C0467_23815 [Planctomycetaceae bacterium]|nr:hypothetical protein [Planctomycetaceae bacterium]
MSLELSAGTPAKARVRTRGISRAATLALNAQGTAATTPAPQVAVAETETNFLVLDNRFGTMIYVILESDPRVDGAFPALAVREILLERRATSPGVSQQDTGASAAIGRDPAHLHHFREFGSDRAVAGAGFILIEPRYVGPSWPAYVSAFRPDGDKPLKRHRETSRPASRG